MIRSSDVHKSRSPWWRPAAANLAVLAAALALPAAASAHGIGGSAVDKSLLEFVPLGMLHMLLGWDHLLFIVGVVLLAGNMRTAAKLITLFVAGHSLTLLIATLAGWKLSATLVDVVIAFSVLYVGVLGFRGGLESFRLTGAIVFGFGLVHGLGLSTRLQDLGLPEDGLLLRVIAFNVGVEIGQLIAIAVIVGLGTLIVRRLAQPGRLLRPTFGTLAAAGLIAAAVLSFPGGEADQDAARAEAVAKPASNCEQAKTDPPPFAGGGHPAKQFFEPGDPAQREEDLTHVIGDGFVIVRYRSDLPDAERAQLRGWIDGLDRQIVGASAGDQQEPIRAEAAYRTLTCQRFDLKATRAFTDRWFADVQAGTYR